MDINGYYLFWAGHLENINHLFIEEFLEDYNKVIVGEINRRYQATRCQIKYIMLRSLNIIVYGDILFFIRYCSNWLLTSRSVHTKKEKGNSDMINNNLFFLLDMKVFLHLLVFLFIILRHTKIGLKISLKIGNQLKANSIVSLQSIFCKYNLQIRI